MKNPGISVDGTQLHKLLEDLDQVEKYTPVIKVLPSYPAGRFMVFLSKGQIRRLEKKSTSPPSVLKEYGRVWCGGREQ